MKRIRKDDELRPEYDFSKLTPAPKNRRPRLSPLVMACLEFKPDAAHINALPDPLRRFIHDIETNADRAGIIRENIRTAGKVTSSTTSFLWSVAAPMCLQTC